ncbi:MAG: amidase family protein [Candidatus Alkaliphilus sp. MAG34]
MNILDKNISELMDLMDKKEITSEEIVKIYMENIFEKKLEKGVYKSLCEKESIEKAKEIDKKRKKGEKLGALAGIPIAVTEDISTKGILTEAGSKILKDYIPPFNATIIEKLLAEDAIILGKVKISEFSLEDSEYGAKCILDRGALVVIGSSGEGRDVVKLKPSYGLVSRYGIISATSSLSPLILVAKEINDLALVLNIISGYDRRDSTSVDLTQGDSPLVSLKKYNAEKTTSPVSKVKIVKELSNDNLVKDIKELGINVGKTTIETGKYILPAFKILSSAEFASITARYDGIRYGYRSNDYENREELYKNTRSEGFGKEAKKTIIFGNHVINAGQYERYYKKSQQIRSLIKDEIDKILEDGSILLLPLSDDSDENLKKGYKELGSMTGYPMLSIPYGGAENEYTELYMLSSGFDEENLVQLANEMTQGATRKPVPIVSHGGEK